jgi:glycosyltransferase involved in cell wall biosynthesis
MDIPSQGTEMKIAMLSPIAWRTPPQHYGPWESVVSVLTEGLVRRGIDVTLFATKDSVTRAELRSVCPSGYEEDRSIDPKVWECLHISEVFEHAREFDLIHNHFDFLPLTYTALVRTPVLATIHGFSSPKILPVYEKYNGKVHYVSISDADRSERLNYARTIHHGIELEKFDFNSSPDDYLLFFGRIHPDKGTREAIEIAKRSGRRLIIAGIIQDQDYFEAQIKPHIDDNQVQYIGSVGPAERNRVLRQACALLHPIYFKEPFGLSVVESMACGTPVIAFNRGSMPELITSGTNGFLVQDVNGAVEALEQIGSLERAACRRTVEERFSVERMVDEYLTVYREILSGTGDSTG